MQAGIYWIASYPRSGNTWTRAFLTALAKGADNAGLQGSLAAPWESARSQGWKRSELVSVLRDRFEWQLRTARSMPGPILLKTHAALVRVKGVSTINAAATSGAVYLVRDPRDVAVSFAAFLKIPIDQIITVMNDPDWFEVGWEPVGSWSTNVASWTAVPGVLVLRYEDLLASPIKLFRALVEHIGFNATLAEVAQATAATSFDRLKSKDAKAPIHTGRTTVRVGRSEQWRSVLTADQIARIESAHGEQMARFGYTPAGQPAPADHGDRPVSRA